MEDTNDPAIPIDAKQTLHTRALLALWSLEED